MREGLAEERFRCDRLEEQVNDLTELHQNEMGNLVTNMADMEEKVQYQSEERIRDLHEIVENCHTRVCVVHISFIYYQGKRNESLWNLILLYCLIHIFLFIFFFFSLCQHVCTKIIVKYWFENSWIFRSQEWSISRHNSSSSTWL